MKLDFEAHDVKGKLIVLKYSEDNFSRDEVEDLGAQLRSLGALGMIFTPPDTEISTLGEQQLQEILDHMKKVRENEKVDPEGKE